MSGGPVAQEPLLLPPPPDGQLPERPVQSPPDITQIKEKKDEGGVGVGGPVAQELLLLPSPPEVMLPERPGQPSPKITEIEEKKEEGDVRVGGLVAQEFPLLPPPPEVHLPERPVPPPSNITQIEEKKEEDGVGVGRPVAQEFLLLLPPPEVQLPERLVQPPPNITQIEEKKEEGEVGVGGPVAQEFLLLSPPPEVQFSELPVHPPPNSVSELHVYKNKLQEYTQKSSLQLPVYQTANEGAQHAPKFRCTVFVDGKSYKSPSTFTQRKLAEQDAARVALDDVGQKIKDVGRPLVHVDTTFCKSILNEYAVKMHIERPTYHTMQREGMLPIFVSRVNINGVSYNGGTGRNKKEAEQLAARAAILSILDSDPTQIISKIIKSKFKLYAALNDIDNSSVLSTALPAVNTRDGLDVLFNKRRDVEVAGININWPLGEISQSSLDELAKIQPTHEPLHTFKKPRPETPNLEMAPPIVFVSAGSEQLQHPSTSLQLPSTSLQLQSTLGVKQSRKSKRKAKRRSEIDAHL